MRSASKRNFSLKLYSCNFVVFKRYTEPKNIALFEEMKVLTSEECHARQSALLAHYTGTVEMELGCMTDMIVQHVIPSCKRSDVGPLKELEAMAKKLKDAMHSIHHESDPQKKAATARDIRLGVMLEARTVCDAAEEVVPNCEWTIPTYKDLLFLDQNHS